MLAALTSYTNTLPMLKVCQKKPGLVLPPFISLLQNPSLYFLPRFTFKNSPDSTTALFCSVIFSNPEHSGVKAPSLYPTRNSQQVM